MLKNWLHKITPEIVVGWYHHVLAILAQQIFRSPSNNFITIGVTGTSGKSTTCELLWSILTEQGYKVGLASGIRFFDGLESRPNNTKMTMVGRFKLQALLSRMNNYGCQYAIVEVTSQGISQWRHRGINFDVILITNLWSEHDEAHGGFDKYKEAKGKLFADLTKKPNKTINNQRIDKVTITNADDQYYQYFHNFNADQKLSYSLKNNQPETITATNIKLNQKGSSFKIKDVPFKLNLLGQHNIYNALAAIATALALGVTLQKSSLALAKVMSLPGRLEFIAEGQNFTVIVDYAFEPKAMQKLYDVVKDLKHNKIIHVLGTTGGGRDAKRGEILGKMAAQFTDYVVATDEDPYDDEPLTLIQRVVTGAQNGGKEIDTNLFIKEKRLDGIAKGISLAQAGDVVLITGKGSEGSMAVAHSKKIPWDDRQVAREILKNK